MKNNLFHRSLKTVVGFITFLVLSTTIYAQTETGAVLTKIFHNTSSTANSTTTYYIELTSGWKPRISSVTSLTLKNVATGTTVYTHSGSTINYGTVTSSLAPGQYLFTGTVSTTNSVNKVVSVSLSQYIWVGYKVLWEKSLDHAEGADQYSVYRCANSGGITRAYSQSFNSLAASTAGWIEMSAPVTTAAGSSVFFVLEPLTNSAAFAPTDDISYVEYFYTNSTTKGVRVKARNSSNVYAMTTLSAVLGDKLLFNRDAAGNAKLYVNNGTTAIYTFAKTITTAIQVNVHTTLNTDIATNLSASFGYPSSSIPLSNTYKADEGTGDLTIRIKPLTGFQSPYHYFVSQNPLPELKEQYRFLKDSIYNGTLDSATFFTGPVSTLSFTAPNIPMGNYYVSAFDSRGVRILNNTYTVLPTLATSDYSDRRNVSVIYNEYLSRAPLSYASPNMYLTEATDGSITYNLSELTNEHSFGLVLPTDAIGSGANSFSKIDVGFCVKNGNLYTVEGGVLSTSFVTAVKGVPIQIVKVGTQIQLISNGTVLLTKTKTGNFVYKVGVYFTQWGTLLSVKPTLLALQPYRVVTSITNNSCTSTGVNLTMTYPTVGSGGFHGSLVSASSFQLYSTNPLTAVGTTNQTSFTNLPVGVYKVIGSVTIGSVTYSTNQYVYVGYNTEWETTTNTYAQNIVGLPPIPHVFGNSSVNPAIGQYGQAIGSGKLPANMAGWMCFTPKSITLPASGGMNTVALSESPQIGQLTAPATTMPHIDFPAAGGMMYVNNPITQTAQIVFYSPNVAIVAQRNGSGVYTLTQNGTQLGTTISSYYFGRWKPSFLIRRPNTGFHTIISNFPCSTPTGQFAHLKYELDGYYHVMNNCSIDFVYNEEYNSSELTFTIYTDDMIKLYDQTNFPIVPVALGDNRVSLYVGDNAHCLGQGAFILDVVNAKKEHFYLRFYNNCSTCAIEGEGPPK